ncbi:hypothetical protein CEXT_357191 [Caerostris extrusa]|uniref:Uncharacterized protein n=1 Tax=Caerostris extrusa TaxID=172846 RepID=A0AAV4SSV1_CAEEX|nr:hypothetical protein CEXT_357191 [Caerostris extrusa]
MTTNQSSIGTVNEGFESEDITNHNPNESSVVAVVNILNEDKNFSSEVKNHNQPIANIPTEKHKSETNNCCVENVHYKGIENYEKCSNDIFSTSSVIISGPTEGYLQSDRGRKDSTISSIIIESIAYTSMIGRLSKPKPSTTKSFTIFIEPIFLLVLFSGAAYAVSFIAFITVIVDFTKDLGFQKLMGSS